jgi:hypothetical protein
MRMILLCMCVLWSCSCNVFGPTCLARQKRGTATALNGQVAAGQLVSHVVAYDTQGSQNDVHISWDGQGTATGPRLSVYATRVECANFVPPSGAGPCAPIGSRGGFRLSDASGDFIQNSLIVTNGRGNPDILGTPAEYKLWVAGDPSRSVAYSISITWFFGPDC